MHYRMFGYVEDVFTRMGPFAAGAASVTLVTVMPLPDIFDQVPSSIIAGGAGYMVAPRGEDQACAALKGAAGGAAAMVVMRILAR